MTEAAALTSLRGAETPIECPVCGSSSLHDFLTGVDYHYRIPGEFHLSRCESCGLAFLNPMPSAADLGSLYPDDYYSFQPPVLPPRLKRLVRKLVGLSKDSYLVHLDRPGTMLDIGCGTGQYLLEMQARGWAVHGSELNRNAANTGKRAGLDIRGGELAEAGFASETFDFVRCNHSFEHIPNPRAVLPEIRRIMKPDGKLLIAVPNIDGLLARLFGRYWWHLALPVHVYAYNPRSLSLLLASAGFDVERVEYRSDWGGTLGSLQILCNRGLTPRRSDGTLLRNRLLILVGQWVARGLDLLRIGDCIEVVAVKSRSKAR